MSLLLPEHPVHPPSVKPELSREAFAAWLAEQDDEYTNTLDRCPIAAWQEQVTGAAVLVGSSWIGWHTPDSQRALTASDLPAWVPAFVKRFDALAAKTETLYTPGRVDSQTALRLLNEVPS